ncbi:MAG: glycerol-3-phosphate 1-O-acyltransferase PlsY [Hyphomicrobiales bacterium]|jgi:glycerol-3-phosphate acyltransferase PlsY|nr:glycerol-3-phosphate 1-O-acyltransferase PlsY [Hyphomicrobiales bacterium]
MGALTELVPPDVLQTVLTVMLGSYLLGSIPFGVVLTKAAGLGDIRAIGSGNIGATNVLRTGKKGLAFATLVLDGLKGTAAIVIVRWLVDQDLEMLAGVSAFFGHLYPVWLRFKGGKGVATLLGILAAVCWPAALGFIAIWMSTAYFFRYSSLAALLASLAVPVMVYYLSPDGSEAFVFAFLVALLWLKHSANIARLWAGTEGKIGAKG